MLDVKKYSVTFYDLVGYLVPGYLFNFLAAMYLDLFTSSELFLGLVANMNVVIGLVLAYASGHLVQGISSLIFKGNYTNWWNGNKWDADFKTRVNVLLKANLNEWFPGHINSQIMSLIESILLAEGQEVNAQVYRALQGFYRGLTSILLLAAFLFLVKGFCYASQPIAGKYVLSQLTTLILCVFLLLSSLLTYVRFNKFFGYRMSSILLGYIALNMKLIREKYNTND